MNDYYSFRRGDTIVPFTRARAQEVSDEFVAVGEGFDKFGARAIQVPAGEIASTLPPAVSRALKLTIFDAGGNFGAMPGANAVVALDSTGKPYGLSIYQVLQELGTQIISEGIWQPNTQVFSQATWKPETPIESEGVWG